MRKIDIHVDSTPLDIRTRDMYMPERKRPAEMTTAQLKLGLCCKSRGAVEACRAPGKPCGIGKELIRREDANGRKQKADTV